MCMALVTLLHEMKLKTLKKKERESTNNPAVNQIGFLQIVEETFKGNESWSSLLGFQLQFANFWENNSLKPSVCSAEALGRGESDEHRWSCSISIHREQ